MMSYIARSKRLSIAILSAILLVLLLTPSACMDPAVWIEFHNQTDQTLSIFIDGSASEGDVLPGETLRTATMVIWGSPDPPWGDGDYRYLIEAKTKDGEVVYSKEFTWQELDDMDWTIVIPPPPE